METLSWCQIKIIGVLVLLACAILFNSLKSLKLIAAIQLARKFLYILGPTGFDSETNGNVSMSSAGIQLVNLIFHTFNWRK